MEEYPEIKNTREKTIKVPDQGGVMVSDTYDFKGNSMSCVHQFAKEYKSTLDWSSHVALEDDRYTTTFKYDALNRHVSSVFPIIPLRTTSLIMWDTLTRCFWKQIRLPISCNTLYIMREVSVFLSVMATMLK
jgi:hypothetical protein